MPKGSSSIEFFRQGVNMGQKVAFDRPLFQKLAGTDREVSDSIAILSYLKKQKMIGEDIDFIIGLLEVLGMSAFATSPYTNEITKMGLMRPQQDAMYVDE